MRPKLLDSETRIGAAKARPKFDMCLVRNEFENSALCRGPSLDVFLRSRPHAFSVSAARSEAFEPAGSRCFPAPFPELC